MPVVHGVLYYKSGLYADFSMQMYYILAGLYGLARWSHKPKGRESALEICFTPKRLWPSIVAVYGVLHIAIYWFLTTFTDSTVPFWDSFTTALCVVAYWLLSRKYVEQWLVWCVVDAITVGLYLYKGIPLTAGLYTLYTALAVVGYLRWRRMIASSEQ